jgi:hypothetical protein
LILQTALFAAITKLIFRNADGIDQFAAVCIDDADIFLRNGRRAMQNNRESGKSSDDFFQNIQTELRLCAGFELVCAVAGADGDGKGIHAGALDKFLDLVRIVYTLPCLLLR